jgi:uncharacterized membrane protein
MCLDKGTEGDFGHTPVLSAEVAKEAPVCWRCLHSSRPFGKLFYGGKANLLCFATELYRSPSRCRKFMIATLHTLPLWAHCMLHRHTLYGFSIEDRDYD